MYVTVTVGVLNVVCYYMQDSQVDQPMADGTFPVENLNLSMSDKLGPSFSIYAGLTQG